jgi:hypothetical protein
MGNLRRADSPRRDLFSQVLHAAVITRVLSHSEQKTSRLSHLLGLGCIHGKWFLAEHSLAMLQREQDIVAMHCIRGGDEHYIHIRGIAEFLAALKAMLDPILQAVLRGSRKIAPPEAGDDRLFALCKRGQQSINGMRPNRGSQIVSAYCSYSADRIALD